MKSFPCAQMERCTNMQTMFNLEHLKMFSNRPALSVHEENTNASLSRARDEAETRNIRSPWGTDKL